MVYVEPVTNNYGKYLTDYVSYMINHKQPPEGRITSQNNIHILFLQFTTNMDLKIVKQWMKQETERTGEEIIAVPYNGLWWIFI